MIATVLLAVTAAVALTDEITGAEVDGFRLFARLPDFLSLPIRGVMQLGTLAGIGVAAGVLLWFTRRWQAAVAAIAAGLVARVASDGLKDVLDRERPLSGVTDVASRDTAGGFGYPSTHAAVAFALAAVAVWWLPRRWRPLVWAIAGLVAVARMYVGVHYPLDVAGGAALGIAAGSIAAALFGVPARPTPHPPPLRRRRAARPSRPTARP